MDSEKIRFSRTDASQNLCAIAFATLFLSLSACSDHGKFTDLADTKRKVADLESQVTDLANTKRQVADLKVQVQALSDFAKQLDENITSVRRERQWDKTWIQLEKIAVLTPSQQGYSTIKFDFGVLTISLANVAPYANGSKVTLKFGNPTSATINNLGAKVEYGSVDGKGLVIEETIKSKPVIITDKIVSGSWTNVELVLDGTPPEKLGIVRIKDLDAAGISLNSP